MKAKSDKQKKRTAIVAKIEEKLSKGWLKEDGLDEFTLEEKNIIGAYFTEKLNELKGYDFDEFYEKIEAVMPKDTKNQIWQRNHSQITWAVSTLLQDNGRMPSPHEIANKSELSVYSVNKHLKEYSKDNRFLASMERFEFMSAKVLARVFKFAVNGDMRAAKLYFEVVGNLKDGNTKPSINTQNNYIQINQFKLSQETIQQLQPEQLKQIENVLQQVVSQQPEYIK